MTTNVGAQRRRYQRRTDTATRHARQLEAQAVSDRALALRLYEAGQFANADALLLLAEDGFHAAKALVQVEPLDEVQA